MPLNKYLRTISAILLLFIFGIIIFQFSKEKFLQYHHDLTKANPTISNQLEFEKIINQYPKVAYSQLNPDYLAQTKSNTKKYKNILKKSNYTVIKREDFFKKIVGDFRIKDFVCKDAAYRKCLSNPNREYYWLIDNKLIRAVFELQNALKKEGYNPKAFTIKSGHRHPKRNEKIKGASSSKHIIGQSHC